MTLPELVANTSTSITTLAKALKTGEVTMETAAAAPVPLRAAGQFRVIVGTEIILVTGGASTTKWNVLRKQEETTEVEHLVGAEVQHELTAQAIHELINEHLGETTYAQLAAAQPFPVELPEGNGALGNGKVLYDAEITAGAGKKLKSKSKPFVIADVGKYVAICSAGEEALVEKNHVKTIGESAAIGEQRQYNTLTARIEAFVNSEEVTLDTEAKTTVTGALCTYASDDTVAIQEAITKAVKRCQEQGTYYCEVWFKQAIYGIAGELKSSPASGTPTTDGNAQIVLPVIGSSGWEDKTGITAGTNIFKTTSKVFKAYDVGAELQAAGKIKAGTTILKVISETEVEMSAASEATGSGITFKIIQTVAQKQGQKVTLVLRSSQESSALPQWYQLAAQQAGSLLFSFGPREAGKANLAGIHAQPEYSTTNGRPAMVGGPTAERGYEGLRFSNMMLVVVGLTISAPSNGTVSGIEAEGVSELSVPSLGSYALGIPALQGESYTGGVNEFVMPCAGFEKGFEANLRPAVALAEPGRGNNDNTNIGTHSVEGHTSAISVGEHSTHNSMRSVYCMFGGTTQKGKFEHLGTVEYWSIEACRFGVYTPAGSDFLLNVYGLDSEKAGSNTRWEFVKNGFIWDTGNLWRGLCNITWATYAPENEVPEIKGAEKCRIKLLNRAQGIIGAPPAVPLTGVALKNPYFTDAVAVMTAGAAPVKVTVSGATGSVMEVEALAGATVTVPIPTMNSITLTYASGSPTLNWVTF